VPHDRPRSRDVSDRRRGAWGGLWGSRLADRRDRKRDVPAKYLKKLAGKTPMFHKGRHSSTTFAGRACLAAHNGADGGGSVERLCSTSFAMVSVDARTRNWRGEVVTVSRASGAPRPRRAPRFAVGRGWLLVRYSEPSRAQAASSFVDGRRLVSASGPFLRGQNSSKLGAPPAPHAVPERSINGSCLPPLGPTP